MILARATVADGRLVEPPAVEATVPWWSFTKTVVAAAALALVAARRLDLETRLAGRPFTLRQLLQHRSGLTDYGRLAEYHAAVARGDAPWPTAALMAAAGADRPDCAPDEGWVYSNIGYLLVRELIEAETGRPLAVALERLVLAPLGATGARLAERPEDLVEVEMGTASGYHPGWVYHGLLVGPLVEAARVLDRLARGDLLPEPLHGLMFTPHRLGGSAPGRPWLSPGYGLGVMSGGTRFGTVAGHTGGGPGSVIAVYTAASGRRRTAAAFALGDDQGAVEEAAMRAATAGREAP